MDIQAYLPLTESTFFILLSLATGPKHGYAIMKEVEMLSETRIQLSTGTLYGAIKRLLDQQWIVRTEQETEGRERKFYALTDLGRKILNAEAARLRELVEIAQPRLAEDRSI